MHLMLGLPFCAGTIDGTFMKSEKPMVWGDTYFATRRTWQLLYLHVWMLGANSLMSMQAVQGGLEMLTFDMEVAVCSNKNWYMAESSE